MLPETDVAPAARTRRRPRGLILYLATVFLLVTLNFMLPRSLPGDPIQRMVGAAQSSGTTGRIYDEASRNELARYYGLDRPLLRQYGVYLAGLVKGDLGTSLTSRVPVKDLLVDRLPWTLLLAGTAVLLATTLGVLAGVHAGWRRGSNLDRGLLTLFTGVQPIPAFFLASLVAFLFSARLGWFPLGGASTPFLSDADALQRLFDVAKHLVLPASVLAVHMAAGSFLPGSFALMRGGMVSELGADYLVLGRAKGLRERRLKYAHVARNALLPVAHTTALQLGFAVTGAIFIETVFAYPGIGRLTADAVAARDYPTIQGCFLLLSLSIVTCNFLADRLSARIDPRTRP